MAARDTHAWPQPAKPGGRGVAQPGWAGARNDCPTSSFSYKSSKDWTHIIPQSSALRTRLLSTPLSRSAMSSREGAGNINSLDSLVG